ncbi:hypothetical protein EYB25_009919 [Talaromyces marneffei]|nr:hypothetical protein EYB25_009919 [Talaromyces marneffei]
MSQNIPSNGYKQGYSKYTLATQQSRTAESCAAFLLPHIEKGDRILDVGCGPGTITTGFAKYVSGGSVVGIDISTEVLQNAKESAAEANVPTEGPGSVVFEQGNEFRQSWPDADITEEVIQETLVAIEKWANAEDAWYAALKCEMLAWK